MRTAAWGTRRTAPVLAGQGHAAFLGHDASAHGRRRAAATHGTERSSFCAIRSSSCDGEWEGRRLRPGRTRQADDRELAGLQRRVALAGDAGQALTPSSPIAATGAPVAPEPGRRASAPPRGRGSERPHDGPLPVADAPQSVRRFRAARGRASTGSPRSRRRPAASRRRSTPVCATNVTQGSARAAPCPSPWQQRTCGNALGGRSRSDSCATSAQARPFISCRRRSATLWQMAKRRLDALLADRGLFESRSRAAASVLAGEVRIGPDGRRAAKPGQTRRRRRRAPPRRAAALRLARRDQARQRARARAGSTRPAAAASTSAPRPAASPTACSRPGPPT